MDIKFAFGIIFIVFSLISGAVFLYYLMGGSRKRNDMSKLMGRRDTGMSTTTRERRERLRTDQEGEEFEKIKVAAKKGTSRKKAPLTVEEKLFRAGIYTDKERRDFARMRILIPFVSTPLFAGFAAYSGGSTMGLIGGIFGVLVGLQLPTTILNRRIKSRNDEIMYYLTLVIEQVVIGVSSSLDIGPCLQRIVQMADERDTHNPVTILLKHAQYHIKSGISMEAALNEIGRLSGHTELKHTFMQLSQVARHGGEITRQLQELADAVAAQRETKIEGKIKKLELEATGPVGLVFLGFILILLTGFGLQITAVFQ